MVGAVGGKGAKKDSQLAKYMFTDTRSVGPNVGRNTRDAERRRDGNPQCCVNGHPQCCVNEMEILNVA